MNAPTKFFVGAVVNPSLAAGRGQLDRMVKKIENGARFFQTQANYDLDDFHGFLGEAKGLNTKIIAGVLLLHSYEMAKYIHENIPGIRIPEAVLERFRNSPHQEQEGIDFATETMLRLESVCDGFHLMSIRAEDLIPKIVESYHDKRNAIQNPSSSLSSPARS